ncbi:MAG TPA: FMN-binding protein [Candidatus Marinimicrobia bacterium]|nr:FMN-binding protein [Candidatus Neomarinimicrobiota bacterium]
MSLKKSYFIPKGLTIVILYITVFPYFLIGGIREDAEELIFSTYGEDIQVDFKKWNPPQEIKIYSEKKARSRFMFDHVYVWKISESNSLVGVAILDNVLGKLLPITYLTCFNLDGQLINAHIVKYREDYGYEVGNKRWLNQFIGLGVNSDFIIGKNIDGISGATISVNSVTRGINRSSIIVEYLLTKKDAGSY